MEKQSYFYKCDENSKVGRAITKFWHRAVNAAKKADEYAKKYGAVSYVQPVQFFEGGVDYLEFGDKKPDARIWRKKFTSKDGHDEYEPNCMYRVDVLVIPDSRFHPSNTWNKVYSKNHITWEQAQPMKTLSQWAGIAGIELTGNREEDVKVVSNHFRKFSFVSFLEFYGDASCNDVGGKHGANRTAPDYLRRAIRAEQDRQALPVLEVGELFALLQAQRPVVDGDSEKAHRVSSMCATPTFFIYMGNYYVCAECPCVADGLHSITEGLFKYKKHLALRQQSSEA